MLAKTVDKRGTDWDSRLLYVLFAYRACEQTSTQESPFFLLYGRDRQLPTPVALSPKRTRELVNLREYGVKLHSETWELARLNITRAQKRQKSAYDRSAKESLFRSGERVFLFKPVEQTGAKRKMGTTFPWPIQTGIEVGPNTAKICPVDKPGSEPILVSLSRLRRCPEEVKDQFWPPGPGRALRRIAPASRRSAHRATDQPRDSECEGTTGGGRNAGTGHRPLRHSVGETEISSDDSKTHEVPAAHADVDTCKDLEGDVTRTTSLPPAGDLGGDLTADNREIMVMPTVDGCPAKSELEELPLKDMGERGDVTLGKLSPSRGREQPSTREVGLGAKKGGKGSGVEESRITELRPDICITEEESLCNLKQVE